MAKISYLDYQKMVIDDEVPESQILEYSLVVKGKGGFDWLLQPNPEKVEISPEEIEAENAMAVGNSLCRFRRANKFRRRKLFGSDLPVIVSEGDSWFQFPLLIKEVIDQLEDDFLIWSVGAAGDTAANMVFGEDKKGATEYLKALRSRRKDVRGFLFSAAGNDIIGENPETGTAALYHIVKPYNGNDTDIAGHIDEVELRKRMDFLENAYRHVVATVRAESGFENLPIFVHGYDYAIPYPCAGGDPRDPSYANKNEWLGEPLDKRGIPHESFDLRHGIIKSLIDTLYLMLGRVAGNSQATGVWLIDCRGSMPEVTDWNDEIHGTSDGFKKVGDRFKQIIGKALAP